MKGELAWKREPKGAWRKGELMKGEPKGSGAWMTGEPKRQRACLYCCQTLIRFATVLECIDALTPRCWKP